MENKYICIFLLHALGDTIGFKNAEWEFNYSRDYSLGTIIEFVFEFIDLGGVNGIDLKDWIISDDTLYHIAIAKTILKYKGILDDAFILLAKNNLGKTHNRMIDEETDKGIFRYAGDITQKYIGKFTDTVDGRNLPYNTLTGGNGAAMRNLCIGAAFYNENQLDTLIDVSINLSKLTHNSALGYLAGFTAAFFVSLAIREINIILL
jgi:ADP-ribosylglycohydrolase